MVDSQAPRSVFDRVALALGALCIAVACGGVLLDPPHGGGIVCATTAALALAAYLVSRLAPRAEHPPRGPAAPTAAGGGETARRT